MNGSTQIKPHKIHARSGLTEEQIEYADLLLRWSRGLEENPMSWDEFCYTESSFQEVENTKENGYSAPDRKIQSTIEPSQQRGDTLTKTKSKVTTRPNTTRESRLGVNGGTH